MGVEIVRKFSRFGLSILAKNKSFRGLKSWSFTHLMSKIPQFFSSPGSSLIRSCKVLGRQACSLDLVHCFGCVSKFMKSLAEFILKLFACQAFMQRCTPSCHDLDWMVYRITKTCIWMHAQWQQNLVDWKKLVWERFWAFLLEWSNTDLLSINMVPYPQHSQVQVESTWIIFLSLFTWPVIIFLDLT